MATSGDLKPNLLLRRVLNPALSALVRLGVMPSRMQLLSVAGRKSGKPRSIPVSPLDLGGRTYLVSPGGEMAWVHNIRVSGKGQLRNGRRMRPITVSELPVHERAAVLRQYYRENRVAVGRYFTVTSVDASLSDFADEADRHPVFAVSFSDLNDRRR